MVTKKNKSKIWGFRHHIQGVPWDLLLPSSTLAFQAVTNFVRPKSPDLGFVLFADHLPDSFISPLELISYLN